MVKNIKKSDKRNILLTVAIPTYNRARSLEKVLQQLSKENIRLFNILVSDNNSPDETKQVVKKYQVKLSNLHYNKNQTNVGYSGNILKLYELSQTRYIWFLSDDETVLPGAIDRIITAIKRFNPVVAVFSQQYTDSYGIKKSGGVKKDILRTNIDDPDIHKVIARTTFLSTLVIQKRISLSVLKKKLINTDYRNNIFFQVTLSLILLNNSFKFAEIASLVVYRNTGYKYGEFFKFCITDYLNAVYMADIKLDKKKFINYSKSQLFTVFQIYLSGKLGLFKPNNYPSLSTLGDVIKYYGFQSIFIFSFPILYYLIPTFPLKILYKYRLHKIHGNKKGTEVYNKNINRVNHDTRKADFINYR